MKVRGRGWLAAVLRIVVLSYAGITVLLFIRQRSYIYYPQRGRVEDLAPLARVDGLEPWRNAHGALVGWRTAPVPGAARLLVFHGNAGHAVDRGYLVRALAERPGGRDWEVYLMEYPGYGARPGSPGEEAILEAAREALALLDAAGGAAPFLLGESLGSGVAARMAGERQASVAGLLLITPFTSLADVAAAHYPGLPVRLLMRDRFDAETPLQRFSGPVAVVLAGRDRVVPARIGRRLYEGYAGPKRMFEQEDRDHNTLRLHPSAAWWDEAFRFLLEAPRG